MTYVDTTTQSNAIQAAYDRYAYAALRHTPLLRSLADVAPEQPAMPGSSLKIKLYEDLAPALTPLNETTDPSAVAVANPTEVTVTPAEYGNATVTTIKATSTAFLGIEKVRADQVAFNMRDSLDVLVANVLKTGTQVIYGGSAEDTDQVAKADVFKSNLPLYAVTKLRGAAAPPRVGPSDYLALVHPDVSHDLLIETGDVGWREAHQFAPGLIWSRNVGHYQGAVWVESARCPVADDGNDARVYRSFVLGKQALAEAVVIEPGVRVGVMEDAFGRFSPLGWYGYLGWNLFRQSCIWRIETGSSVADDVPSV